MKKVIGMVMGKLCFQTAICTSDDIARDWGTVQDFTYLKTALVTTVNGDKALNTVKEPFGTLMELDTRVRNDRQPLGKDDDKGWSVLRLTNDLVINW